MSFLQKIGSAFIGGGAAESAKALGGLATSIREAIKGKELDPNQQLELGHKLIAMQSEVNKIEAAHRTVFVAGWRPFIGWVCGVSLAAFYIPQFVMGSYMWVKICLAAGEITPYPMDDTGLMQLVLAMLGMAGIRTYEKVAGKSK